MITLSPRCRHAMIRHFTAIIYCCLPPRCHSFAASPLRHCLPYDDLRRRCQRSARAPRDMLIMPRCLRDMLQRYVTLIVLARVRTAICCCFITIIFFPRLRQPLTLPRFRRPPCLFSPPPCAHTKICCAYARYSMAICLILYTLCAI